MARYKVEYEIEGILKKSSDGQMYVQGDYDTVWLMHDARVTEIKPPFEPGYYRRRGYATADVTWRVEAPASSGEDWRDHYVRVQVEPEDD